MDGGLEETLNNVRWLADNGALKGVAAIAAERRRQIQDGDEAPGEYAAETALNFGETAQAGALAARMIDSEPD